MTARALPRLEDATRGDLARWSAAAFAVLCLHAALIASYLLVWRPQDVDVGEEAAAISIELTAPQIDQVEQPPAAQPTPPQQTSPPVTTPVEPIPPQPTSPDTIAAAQKPAKPQKTTPDATTNVEKTKTQPTVAQTSPATRTTVHEIARAPRIDPSWQSLLVRHLQELKSYPRQARRRREQGVVLLTFSVDRDGHVVSRQIVKGSGFADLDAEVLTLLQRAQPLPAFPASMTERTLTLTVPIRFALR